MVPYPEPNFVYIVPYIVFFKLFFFPEVDGNTIIFGFSLIVPGTKPTDR